MTRISSPKSSGIFNTLKLLLLLLAPVPSWSFYLPGMAPTSYRHGDPVPLTVNVLKPFQLNDDPLQSVIAYDYYMKEFHFCAPAEGPEALSESLGSILFGDRIFTSPIRLHMRADETCKNVCPDGKPVEFTPRDTDFVNLRIKQKYVVDWLADGLPAGMRGTDEQSGEEIAIPGFALGQVDPETETAFLNNHFDMKIEYHEAGDNEYRVVGFTVVPSSRKDNTGIDGNCGTEGNRLQLSDTQVSRVYWTYSVQWIKSDTSFATRWDKYLHVVDPRIHWFWLVNAAVVVILLVAMVSTILMRTLRKDIARYNRLDEIALDDLGGTGIMDDSVQEDSGWKLVHGDVFRPPRYPLPLAVLIGNGAQLFMMTGFTIVFAAFGFLSPSSRGSLGTVIILFYTIFGFVSGYISARVYKFMQGEGWKRNFLYTPIILPIFVFAIFFFLNLFLWGRQAAGAVPFGTMLVLVLIWFVITLPLSLAGSWVGFKSVPVTAPTRTNQIPRQIPPPTSTYMKPIPSVLLAGVLPFVAISIELSAILSSLWSGRIYYMFGFLFLCYGLMIVMCAAVTVLMVYFLLCGENYHWQWRSFLCSGATGVYVLLYSLLHWARYMALSSFTGTVLYLGYSVLISVLVFIMTGTIGFLAAWMFVLKIYGSIKVD